MGKDERLIIVGGAAALAMALVLAKRPHTLVTVIENRLTSAAPDFEPFLVDDLSSDHRSLLNPAVVAEWGDFLFSIDGKAGQQSCRVALLHLAQIHFELGQRLNQGRAVISAKIGQVLEDRVVTDQGTFTADLVIDARLSREPCPGAMHVMTEWVELVRPHGLRCPILIDTEVGAAAGWSFVQYIPVGASHLLIRAVGHGAAGEPIDISPTEGRLVASRQAVYPLIPQRHSSGEPISVSVQCPHPLVPSELPAALSAAGVMLRLPSLGRCDSHAAFVEYGKVACAQRLENAQICQELASVHPPGRASVLQRLLVALG